VLRYSLGQRSCAIDFRRILDRNQSLIINLALANADARRLLGCLLTVAAEQAALSRAELPATAHYGSHHLILDEFADFTAQSETQLTDMLSHTRKYGLYVVLVHQTWSQASERLRGALENVGTEVVFRLGRRSAEYAARDLGRVTPEAVKHTVADHAAVDRTHPLFYSLPEQWERVVQQIQDLKPREALIKPPSARVTQVRTLAVPDPQVASATVAAVQARYLATYFRDEASIEAELAAINARTRPPTTQRFRPLGEQPLPNVDASAMG
jgi:hypothetical protein